MRVDLINAYKADFKAHLATLKNLPQDYYFHIITNWQNHWNIEGIELADIYDKSLQSDYSAHLWGGNINSPKSVMTQLINTEKEFMRSSFRDLLNHEKDLGLRLDRFSYHCDQVLTQLQKQNKKISGHLQDRKIMCLYLALDHPNNYCLWNFPAFASMMQKIGSRNIPSEVEVERYYKSCIGINNLLSKDVELIDLLNSLLSTEAQKAPILMLMSVFMEFVSQQPNKEL